MDKLVGSSVKGYEIRQLIGSGGFGSVYQAFQPAVNREVAIKVILPIYADEPTFIRRFDLEAQIVARLEHPHIVPLYDYWRQADGAYLVMRYLRGGSLDQYLKEHGPLSLEHALSVMEQICTALHTAHKQEIIHRDLKPANVLFDHNMNAYLSDFGIAKVLDMDMTQKSQIMGSLGYMPPEVLTGQPVTAASDVFSLGIVLFEMFTAQHPLGDLSEKSLADIVVLGIEAQYPRLSAINPDLPADLDKIITQALSKDPKDRQPDVLGLLADVRRVVVANRPDDFLETTTIEEQLSGLLTVENPYKGLRSFTLADSEDFHGRQALIERLLARLADDDPLSRFLAVVGPSGSGKSSVVKAGLLPALQQGRLPNSEKWFFIEMMPGQHPVAQLEEGLARIARQPLDIKAYLERDAAGLVLLAGLFLPQDESELLLIVDQFEEVFTLAENAGEASQFLDLIYYAVKDKHSRVRVIVTLRADLYDRPLLLANFSALMQARTEIVTPLSPSELEEAITKPARRINIKYDTDVVTAIVTEVNQQPGALPLLQYALTEMFDQRQGTRITSALYKELGGALGAMARRAEEIYNELTEPQQKLARELFLRLITLGEGVEDTRRRVLQRELLAISPDMDEVLAIYERSRLLTFDRDSISHEPTVDLGHEAIIREWARFRRWLDEGRTDIRQQRMLATMTADWKNSNLDKSYLLRGSRLDQMNEWIQSSSVSLTDEERRFIQESLQEAALVRQAEEAHRLREQRLERRARTLLLSLLALMALAAVIASGLAVVALGQSSEAQHQRDLSATSASIARQNAGTALSITLMTAARQAVGTDNDLAMALALEANRVMPDAPDTQRLLARLAYLPGTRSLIAPNKGPIDALAISGDGSMIAAAAGLSITVWKTTTGERLQILQGHTDKVTALEFAPTGADLISVSADQTAILWDAAAGTRLRQYDSHSRSLAVDFSPDAKMFIAGGRENVATLWDLDAGTSIRTFQGHTGAIGDLVFSPDGKYVVTAGRDNLLILWDVQTGSIVQEFKGHTGSVLSVAFSADGKQIISGAADNSIRLWNVSSGVQLREYTGHTDAVSRLAMTPDGSVIMSGSWDKTVRLWNTATGELLYVLTGHTDRITALRYDAETRTLVSASADGTIRLWEIPSLAEKLAGHTDTVNAVVYSPDGKYAASGGKDKTILLWDMSTHTVIRRFEGHTDAVSCLAFSPDGKQLVSGSADDTVRLWDVESGQQTVLFRGHQGDINSVAFSPDGSQLVTGSVDTTVRVWDAKRGVETNRFTLHSSPVYNALFTPDGKRLLIAQGDYSLRLLDLATGQEIRKLTGHSTRITALTISPDGRWAVSGGTDHLLIVWDLAAGQLFTKLTDHQAAITGVAFSPDGKLFLSSSADSYLILWNLDTWKPIATLRTPGAQTALALSPDQGSLLSANGSSLLLWHVIPWNRTETWIAQNRYQRPFSCDERQNYLIEPLCKAK